VLLASFIAIPALAAQGGFSAEKEPVATERMYAGHKVQQEKSRSGRRQCTKGRGSRWKAMLSAAGRVVHLPRPNHHQSRIPQKVWNGQHFDAQDLVWVSGQISHKNVSTLDVEIISKP
jgi:uncharacterized protein YdeI (BOF family)